MFILENEYPREIQDLLLIANICNIHLRVFMEATSWTQKGNTLWVLEAELHVEWVQWGSGREREYKSHGEKR